MKQMSEHNLTGKLGEDLAAYWLTSRGHEILARNYFRKWGEIDSISFFEQKVYFNEVKAVSYGTRLELIDSVSRGTYRPEEQVHEGKMQRLYRAIETWIAEQHYIGEWQINVITVRMVPHEKYALVNMIENITRS